MEIFIIDEDMSEALINLFLERIELNIQYFTTSRKNQAMALYNFIYYLKTNVVDHNDGSIIKRWICNKPKCSWSISSKYGIVIKVNGKKYDFLDLNRVTIVKEISMYNRKKFSNK